MPIAQLNRGISTSSLTRSRSCTFFGRVLSAIIPRVDLNVSAAISVGRQGISAGVSGLGRLSVLGRDVASLGSGVGLSVPVPSVGEPGNRLRGNLNQQTNVQVGAGLFPAQEQRQSPAVGVGQPEPPVQEMVRNIPTESTGRSITLERLRFFSLPPYERRGVNSEAHRRLDFQTLPSTLDFSFAPKLALHQDIGNQVVSIHHTGSTLSLKINLDY